jgi:hypothetical protein
MVFIMNQDPYITVVDAQRNPSPKGPVSDSGSSSTSLWTPPISATPKIKAAAEEQRQSENKDGNRDAIAEHNLRPKPREGSTCFVTWWDADDSGNYDPALEGKRAKGKKRVRLQSLQNIDEEEVDSRAIPENNKRLEHSSLGSRQRGCAFTLTIPYTALNDRGLALLKNIPDKWPEKYHNVLSDEYVAKQSAELKEMGRHMPYLFRNKLGYNTTSRNSTDDERDNFIKDPACIEEDLTNHPAARGCVACRLVGLHCSLLEDECTWPCNSCIEDDCDCELIVPPSKKSTCEQCRRKRFSCSYSYANGDPRHPCSHCDSMKIHCVAGPSPRTIRERISYDRDYTISKKSNPRDRQYVTCTACRTDRVSCSLRHKTDDPPCDQCINRGLNCIFEAVRRKKKRDRVIPKGNNKVTAEQNTKDQLFKSQDGNISDSAIWIKTSLCHPITFLEPDPGNCHWCANPGYGILGLGVKDVLIQPSESGLEYHEISGGHYQAGQQTSKICIICTMSRVRIVGCPEHELRPLDGYSTSNPNTGSLLRSDQMDLEDLDVEAAFDRLMDCKLLPSDKWCSLCPSLALYRCCTPQETDMWGEPIDPNSNDAEACGLLLCEECAIALNDDEDLEAVIDAIASDVEMDHWGMGLRADAEFFRKDGLLIRKVCEGLENTNVDV